MTIDYNTLTYADGMAMVKEAFEKTADPTNAAASGGDVAAAGGGIVEQLSKLWGNPKVREYLKAIGFGGAAGGLVGGLSSFTKKRDRHWRHALNRALTGALSGGAAAAGFKTLMDAASTDASHGTNQENIEAAASRASENGITAPAKMQERYKDLQEALAEPDDKSRSKAVDKLHSWRTSPSALTQTIKSFWPHKEGKPQFNIASGLANLGGSALYPYWRVLHPRGFTGLNSGVPELDEAADRVTSGVPSYLGNLAAAVIGVRGAIAPWTALNRGAPAAGRAATAGRYITDLLSGNRLATVAQPSLLGRELGRFWQWAAGGTAWPNTLRDRGRRFGNAIVNAFGSRRLLAPGTLLRADELGSLGMAQPIAPTQAIRHGLGAWKAKQRHEPIRQNMQNFLAAVSQTGAPEHAINTALLNQGTAGLLPMLQAQHAALDIARNAAGISAAERAVIEAQMNRLAQVMQNAPTLSGQDIHAAQPRRLESFRAKGPIRRTVASGVNMLAPGLAAALLPLPGPRTRVSGFMEDAAGLNTPEGKALIEQALADRTGASAAAAAP